MSQAPTCKNKYGTSSNAAGLFKQLTLEGSASLNMNVTVVRTLFLEKYESHSLPELATIVLFESCLKGDDEKAKAVPNRTRPLRPSLSFR